MLRTKRRIGMLVSLLAIAGCAADDASDEEEGESLSEEALVSGYTSLGLGVAYKRVEGGGDAVFIGYGGYSIFTGREVQTQWIDVLAPFLQ